MKSASQLINPTDGHSAVFVVIVAGFVTSLMVANIIAVKLIAVGPWIMPAGVIIFPLSYILGDVLIKSSGWNFGTARRVITTFSP